MNTKLSTITIQIPFRKAGNVIVQQEVQFEVFHEDNTYTLKPILSEEELLIANLPNELQFTFDDGKPVSLQGNKDSNFHVITDAVQVLQQNGVLY